MSESNWLENSPEHLKVRTKKFALAIMRLCEALPRGRTSDIIAKQLIRAACSVGANYRAACRGMSKPDWIAKLGIVLKEIDESQYWIELLVESNLISKEKGDAAIKEAEEILSMVASSIKTSKLNPKG